MFVACCSEIKSKEKEKVNRTWGDEIITVLSYPLLFLIYSTLCMHSPHYYQHLFSQPYPSATAFSMQVSMFEEKNHMIGHLITIYYSTRACTSLQQSYSIWSCSSRVNGLAPHGTCFHITGPLHSHLAIAVSSLLNHQPNYSICL